MDIFQDWDPVALAGAGWYSKEKNPAGNRFRWVGDGAWLDVAQLPGVGYEITFDVEPGPAVGHEQFDLALYEDGKTKLASLPVPGRTEVTFRLPPGDPRVHHLELRAENGGRPVEAPGDPRTLRYRVFSVTVTPTPDVSHLEKQIEDRDAELYQARAAYEELEKMLASEAEEHAEKIGQLQREVDARDAIIERLKQTEVEEYAAKVGQLQSEVDARDAIIERLKQTVAEEHAAKIGQLQREVDARDAIIERLEHTAGRLRSEVDELQRAVESARSQLAASQQLAEERLAVIRAMHDQSQAPAS